MSRRVQNDDRPAGPREKLGESSLLGIDPVSLKVRPVKGKRNEQRKVQPVAGH
jgi:hypothetical protein